MLSTRAIRITPYSAIPPYHLTSITKRFGGASAKPAKHGKDGAYRRASKGFMGKTWDGGDVAFRPETWAALGEKLYPGAFGMAFAGSRGWHRLAVAIEDAGLIIHPAIFLWAYSSGFPKATRIDTQIDKAAGVERPIVGDGIGNRANSVYGTFASRETGIYPQTTPATSEAQTWQGYRYGLQALKPAVEPIIVFQRPYEGRAVDSIVATGAGALNIDEGRNGVESVKSNRGLGENSRLNDDGWQGVGQTQSPTFAEGRWPANFALDSEAAKRLDEQSGDQIAHSGRIGMGSGNTDGMFGFPSKVSGPQYDDRGGASRYFHTYDWNLEVEERIASAEPVLYEPKAPTVERNAGLRDSGLPTHSRLSDGNADNWDLSEGKVRARLPTAPQVNHHPTQKPIGLTEWLAKLLLPPDVYAPRRLLVPFAGAGSEMIGAFRAGWDWIDGIEMVEEYALIARARLDYWIARGAQTPHSTSVLNKTEHQLSMFGADNGL